MSLGIDLGAAVLFGAVGVALVEAPRRLHVRAGGESGSTRFDAWLSFGFTVLGFAGFKCGLGVDFVQSMVVGLSFELLAAVVYGDLRYQSVSPVCWAPLALLAVARAAIVSGWIDGLLGALVCGVVMTAGVLGARQFKLNKGVGTGTIGLAAALGGMVGVGWGLRVLAAAVVCSALAFAVLAITRGDKPEDQAEPLAAPLGAALALAGFAAVIVIWK